MKLKLLSIIVALTFAGSLDAYARPRSVDITPEQASVMKHQRMVKRARVQHMQFFDITHDPSLSKGEREGAIDSMQALEKKYPEEDLDLQG